MSAAALLADLTARGIRLAPEGGTAVRARGPLTDQDRAAIRAHKTELLAALTENRPAEPPQDARSAPAPVSTIPFAEVLHPAEAEDRLEHFAERAAILELDAELPRHKAEDSARRAVLGGRYPYYFRLREYPGESPVFVTPTAVTAAEATREIEARFGEGRVLRCWPVSEPRPAGAPGAGAEVGEPGVSED